MSPCPKIVQRPRRDLLLAASSLNASVSKDERNRKQSSVGGVVSKVAEGNSWRGRWGEDMVTFFGQVDEELSL